MPLTASTWPARSSVAAAAMGSAPACWPASGAPVASSSRSRGPQAGQQTGWAWNLRSAGLAYSAAHWWHIRKLLIVVSGRS